MKKISITFLLAALVGISGVYAQTLQEGVNDFYARRYKSAKNVFEKLLATNPNNIDATYWLGQTYIGMEDVAGAKSVYDKALMASANAPLVIVGMGQVELMQNKTSEARQRFEAAITMTRGKKGDDPVILNAVGRAITETYNDKDKKGDINYAVEKLEAAAQKDPKNPEIFLNLGNAYRKAKPGEGGGRAFETYRKGIEANPNFPVNYYRIAQLFYSQRNWELYLDYLNQAVTKDPRFAPAYYDLYYYSLLGKKDFGAADEYAKKYIASADEDPQNDYLRAQTLWAHKKYDEAITVANSIIAKAGDKTKADTYKIIAYSYVGKGDTAGAKPFIDDYFTKAKPEDIVALDYKLKADIYSAIPGQEEVVYNSYMDGLKADTVVDNKIELLKQGAAFFKAKGQREKEGDMLSQMVQIKPKPTINDMFDVGRAYYFGGAYIKSYNSFIKFTEKYPDEVFGWEWKFNNAKIIDSTKKDSIAVPDALKLVEFSQKDTTKYKKQLVSAVTYLATYYANDAKDKTKAVEYLKKMQELDPANRENIQKLIDQLNRSGGGQTRPAPKTNGGGGSTR